MLVLIAVPTVFVTLHEAGVISIPVIVDYLRDIPLVAAASDVAEQSLLAVGIMASAIRSANEARSRMDMDERNAARYGLTFKNLDYLSGGPLAKARAAAVAGDEAVVKRFVAAVQDQISAEHRQWIELTDAMGPVAPDI